MVEEDAPSEADGEKAFLELYRLYPLIQAWDYIVDGRWDLKKLEIDSELITAHRKEAGAPEPAPLDQMEKPHIPDLSKARVHGASAVKSGLLALTQNRRGVASTAVRGTAVPVARKETLASRLRAGSAALLANARRARTGTAGGAGSVGAIAGSTETAMVEFARSRKIEPARTRRELLRLSLERRQMVMNNFRGSSVEALVQYIQKLPKPAAAVGSTAGRALPAPRAVSNLSALRAPLPVGRGTAVPRQAAAARPAAAATVKRSLSSVSPSATAAAPSALRRRVDEAGGSVAAARASPALSPAQRLAAVQSRRITPLANPAARTAAAAARPSPSATSSAAGRMGSPAPPRTAPPSTVAGRLGLSRTTPVASVASRNGAASAAPVGAARTLPRPGAVAGTALRGSIAGTSGAAARAPAWGSGARAAAPATSAGVRPGISAASKMVARGTAGAAAPRPTMTAQVARTGVAAAAATRRITPIAAGAARKLTPQPPSTPPPTSYQRRNL